MTSSKAKKSVTWRNSIAFWVFGLCNNYGYVIMLSAAHDIIEKHQTAPKNETCIANITSRACGGHKTSESTGAILLADILPSLLIKLLIPFFMHRIPYGFRHFLVVLLQAGSYLLVSMADSYALALLGVVMASLGAGIGETTYLSLSSHFPASSIAAWSSGTGGAGVIGSFAYAALTDKHLAGISPRHALLVMEIVPLVFAVAYWGLLVFPSTVYSPNWRPTSWIVPSGFDGRKASQLEYDAVTGEPLLKKAADSHRVPQRVLSLREKLKLILPLLKLMIPLVFVYYGEYVINQGLLQLIYFDCARGFGISKGGQYRWYQVLYQVGVFISRSSVRCVELPLFVIYLLPFLQMANAVFFLFEALYSFLPHISIAMAVILVEGLYGGGSYVNTFNYIHRYAEPDIKEYSLSVASISDSLGILAAAFSAIILHNYLCTILV